MAKLEDQAAHDDGLGGGGDSVSWKIRTDEFWRDKTRAIS